MCVLVWNRLIILTKLSRDNYSQALRESIEAVGQDSWTAQLGNALTDHLAGMYDGDPVLKGSCFHVLGLVIQLTEQRELPNRWVNTMLEVRHLKRMLQKGSDFESI